MKRGFHPHPVIPVGENCQSFATVGRIALELGGKGGRRGGNFPVEPNSDQLFVLTSMPNLFVFISGGHAIEFREDYYRLSW